MENSGMELNFTFENTEEQRNYVDKICKEILSNKRMLAHIIHDFVHEMHGYSLDYIMDNVICELLNIEDIIKSDKIIGLNTEHTSIYGDTVIFDLLFLIHDSKTSNNYALILNLEAQSNYHPGYNIVKRAIAYCAHMILLQLGQFLKDIGYEELKKVYSIWVCTKVPQKIKNTITSYIIDEHCLLGNVCEERKIYDLMEVVIVRLGDTANNKNFDALNVLNYIFCTSKDKHPELTEEFNSRYPQDAEIFKEEKTVSHFLDGYYLAGVNEGMEQGMAKGMEIMLTDNLKNVIAILHISPEKAMDTFKIPLEKREHYMDILRRESPELLEER